MLKKLPKPKKLATVHKRIKPPATPTGPNVLDHSYSPETGQLTVTFRGGRQYRYDGVKPETYKALEAAPSVGSFLHASVIGKHDATKIDT